MKQKTDNVTHIFHKSEWNRKINIEDCLHSFSIYRELSDEEKTLLKRGILVSRRRDVIQLYLHVMSPLSV